MNKAQNNPLHTPVLHKHLKIKKQMCRNLAGIFLHSWYVLLPCQKHLFLTIWLWKLLSFPESMPLERVFLCPPDKSILFCRFSKDCALLLHALSTVVKPLRRVWVCLILLCCAYSPQHSKDGEQGLAHNRCSTDGWWRNKYGNSHHYSTLAKYRIE